MLVSLAAVYPVIHAYINRDWRGEDGAPKWAFFAFSMIMAFCLTLDIRFAAAWLFFLACYAVLPWHAMFSAVHGRPPGRRDPWYCQWMQTLAMYLAKNKSPSQKWFLFGIYYGTIRATPMIIGAYVISSVIDYYIPLALSPLFLTMGSIYALCGEISRDNYGDESHAVEMAEKCMGFMHGLFMVYCAWCTW